MIHPMRIARPLLLVALMAATGGGCTKSARLNRALSKGDAAFAAEDYDKAEAAYKQAAMLISPPSTVAMRQLGLLYAAEGRPTATAVFLEKAVKDEPDNAKAQVELSSALLQLGKPAEAKESATRGLKLDPGNERALLVLCEMTRSPQESDQTRVYIEKLRQQDKDRASYHLAFGVLAAKQSKLAEAETEFRKAQAMDPNSAPLASAMASLDIVNGDPKGAEELYKNAAAKAPLRSLSRMQYAEFQFQHGETNQAVASLIEINHKVPDYRPASLLLMRFTFAERKFDECSSYINQILEREPGNLETLMQKGALSFTKGNSAQAVADYERILALYPKEPLPQVQFDLARSYLLAGNVSKAIAALNRAVTVQPNYLTAKLLLAELEIRQGNAAGAIPMLTDILKVPHLPDAVVAEASLALANGYIAQNNTGQAVAVYRQLETNFPRDPQMPFFAAQALLRDGKPEAARAEFEKTHNLEPNSMLALEGMVDLDLGAGHIAIAAKNVQKEIDRNPTNYGAWILQAKVLIASKDVPQAEAALQKAISIEPKVPTPYIALAQLYIANQQQKEALDKLTALVSLTNDVAALTLIGEIHNQAHEYDLARQSYEKALKINPQFGSAINNLAYLDSEHFNDLDKALALAETNRALFPHDPHIADTLGWILFKKHEYPRALAMEEEGVAAQPNDPEVQFHLGMAHYMMGNESPAQVAFQFAAAKGDFTGKDEAVRRLAIIAIDPKTATAAQRNEIETDVKKDPADPIATRRLAELQERDGEWQKAAATYEIALQQSPQDFRDMARLAQIYSTKLNQPQKAMVLAKNAYQHEPNDPYISATLGRLVFQANEHDYSYALSLLQAAARGLPGQPDLLHDLAWAYFATGDTVQARATMESALQLGTPFAKLEDAKQFVDILQVYGNPGEPQADSKVKQVLQSDPNYAPALFASGLIQEKQGHAKEAEASYQKVLTNYPSFLPAERQLAILFAKDGNNDAQATTYGEKARAAYPEDLELAKYSGIVAYRRGEYAPSSQYLTQSMGRSGSDAETLYYLGLDNYHLKDYANSKKNLQRAVDLKLADNLAPEARRVLALPQLK
jgi:tetratricopeptide (TPR) repeat protein